MSAGKLAVVQKNSHPGRNSTPGFIRSPTREEVRAARLNTKDTQLEASRRIRGGEKAFEKYETESKTEGRKMHPGLFELYLIKTDQPVPKWLKGE